MGPSAGRGAALPAAVGAAVRAQAVRASASARRHKLQAAGACFGLRQARRGGLEQVRRCWLRPARHSAAAGAAQRAVSGACPAGYCIAPKCGNFGAIYELGCLLEMCSLFSGSAPEDFEISLFFIYLSVSKDTTQESGTARCLP